MPAWFNKQTIIAAAVGFIVGLFWYQVTGMLVGLV